MNHNSIKQIKISFFIAIVYVGIGTLSVLSSYPDAPLYGNWVIIADIITLPVNFVSIAIVFASPKAYTAVIIVQIAYFLLAWFVLFRLFVRKSKRACAKDDDKPRL